MKSKRVIVFTVLIVALTAFIWSNSFMSREDSGALSGGIMLFLKNIVDPNGRIDPEFFHHIIRKAAHFTEFFALGALYTFYRRSFCVRLKEKLMLLPVFATLLTAVVDEFIQYFADRGSAVKDVVLDFSGALTAILITELCICLYRRTKSNSLVKK